MIAFALAAVLAKNAITPRVDEIWAFAEARVSRQIDAWFEAGDFPRATELLRIQFAAAPKDYEVATNLGWLLESQLQDDEALAVYSEYRRNAPEDPDGRLPEAMLYNSRRRYADVVTALEPIVAALKPNGPKPHPNVYRLLAKSYERLGKLEAAIRVWNLQLKAYPNDRATQANLARVKAKMRR